MRTTGRSDRARGLVLAVGVAVLGLSVALGVFIQRQSGDPRPPEDVPRALAIPALYATMGLLAIIGALQRRPAIVVGAGVLCLAGMILSVATIGLAVPGLVLVLAGPRIRALPAPRGSEAASAAAAVLLVAGAAVALIAMTGERCWQATGSPAAPIYTVISCAGPGILVSGGQAFASGSDSGALTTGGGLVEATFLISALSVAVVTGRTRTGAGVRTAADQVPRQDDDEGEGGDHAEAEADGEGDLGGGGGGSGTSTELTVVPAGLAEEQPGAHRDPRPRGCAMVRERVREAHAPTSATAIRRGESEHRARSAPQPPLRTPRRGCRRAQRPAPQVARVGHAGRTAC